MEAVHEIAPDLPPYHEGSWRLRAYIIGDITPGGRVRELTLAESIALRHAMPDPLSPDEPLFGADDPRCLPTVLFRAPKGCTAELEPEGRFALKMIMAGLSRLQISRGSGTRSVRTVQRDWNEIRGALSARNLRGAIAKALVLRQLEAPELLKEPAVNLAEVYALALSALEVSTDDMRSYIGFRGRNATGNDLLTAASTGLCDTAKTSAVQAIGQAFAHGIFMIGRPYGLPYRQELAPEPMPLLTPELKRPSLRDRLSSDDVAAIVAAHRAGVSQRAIAERYGISQRSVGNVLRRIGRES